MTEYRLKRKYLRDDELRGDLPISLPDDAVPLGIDWVEQGLYDTNQDYVLARRRTLLYLIPYTYS